MSIRNAIAFGAIAIVVVAATDFAMAMKKAGDAYGIMQHLEARLGRAMTLMPGSAVARALPQPPEGWQVRVGLPADSFLVTGLPADGVQLAGMETMQATLLEALPGMQMENRLYQKDDTAVYYGVNVLPANIKDTKASQVMRMMYSMFDGQATDALNPGEDAFAVRKYSAPELGRASIYYTQVDGQIFISALSNAGDEATLALMSGVNRDALLTMVAGDPTIGQTAGSDAAPGKAGCVQKGAAKFCSSTN